MDAESIRQLIKDALEAACMTKGLDAADFSDETVLHGPGAALDSLDLVMSIVEIESRFGEATGAEVNLADAVALPPEESPLRTLGTLAAHLVASA